MRKMRLPEMEETRRYNRDYLIRKVKNGGDYVRSNFAWDVIVEKYKKFFAEVIGEREQ